MESAHAVGPLSPGAALVAAGPFTLLSPVRRRESLVQATLIWRMALHGLAAGALA